MAIKYPKLRCLNVIPANAGIQSFQCYWIPICHGRNDVFNCRVDKKRRLK